MYLIIDTTTNVVKQGLFELREIADTERAHLLNIGEFQEDMLGSIFLAVDNYLPRPRVDGQFVDYIIAQDNVWVDTRPDAQQWDLFRARRNAELTASDWTQLKDSPLDGALKAAWVDWRQELRNIPQTVNTAAEAESALNILLGNKPS